MLTLKQFDKAIMMMCMYGAGRKSIYRYCGAHHIKHFPARYKKRRGMQGHAKVQAITFGARYGGNPHRIA